TFSCCEITSCKLSCSNSCNIFPFNYFYYRFNCKGKNYLSRKPIDKIYDSLECPYNSGRLKGISASTTACLYNSFRPTAPRVRDPTAPPCCLEFSSDRKSTRLNS